ncbi:hypothetical protein ACH4S8_03230 [Streptomyces sp. NPDC021080]|uniref:hypothetical protein n=1 Tax=Streptomyces sp. NPDC021080 TaxID=3365110 RepID=UPI0037BAE64F
MALTRLLKGDWIGPARIAALPAALLLLLSLLLALTAEDVPFGGAFPTALAVVLSALGAHPGLDLTGQDSTPPASLELSLMPLGVTLLWAAALWFGARLYLRGAAGAGKHLDTAETLFLGVRSVLAAVIGSVLLAWAAGTSVTVPSSDPSDPLAAFLAPFLGPDLTLSVTCSPLRAAWWTLVLASVVLFPTLCRTSMSAWTARRPGLGDWLRATRRAGVALAVPLSLAGLAAVVFLVSEGGFPALIPAVLLAPNLAVTLLGLGSGASVDFADTLVIPDSDSEGTAASAVSLFDLQDLSGWVWVSVLLGVVAAVVLGAGVLREAARPAAAVRAVVCFVSGFLLLAVMAGIAVELSSEIDDSSSLAHALAEQNISPVDGSTMSIGLGIPTVLLAATVWAVLGAFGVPALARRLGITRVEDVPALSALRERLSGRPGPVPSAMTVPVAASAPLPAPVPATAPVPASAPVPVVAPVPVAPPSAPPVTAQASEAALADAAPHLGAASTPSTEDRAAEVPAEETADAAVTARATTPPAPAAAPAKSPAVSTVKEPGAAEATARPVIADEPTGPTTAEAAAPAESAPGPLAGAGQETADVAAPVEPRTTVEAAEVTEPAEASEATESADEPTEPATEPAARPTDELTVSADGSAASAEAGTEPTDEPTAPADEPAGQADRSAQPTPTEVDIPVDSPTTAPDHTEDYPAEEAAVGRAEEAAPSPSTAPPVPPALHPAAGPAAGLLKTPAAVQPGAQFQPAPAGGAGNHAAAFASLPTGNMAYPAPAPQVVHGPVPQVVHGPVPQVVHGPVPQVVHGPVPQPGRRKIGWGVVALTLVASAVLAGGVTAAAIMLASDRSASPSHTTRATDDAVVPGTATSGPPSAPASAAPTGTSAVPSDSGASPSASVGSPEDIVREVQSLLDENDPLRTRVQKAIARAKDCSEGAGPVRDARDDLEAVAEAREGFVKKLAPLTPQADGDLAEALNALSLAWTESAEADRAYSLWASDTVEFVTDDPIYGCGHDGQPGADYRAGTHNAEATKAKERFATLWNSIALQYDGLTPVDADHI